MRRDARRLIRTWCGSWQLAVDGWQEPDGFYCQLLTANCLPNFLVIFDCLSHSDCRPTFVQASTTPGNPLERYLARFAVVLFLVLPTQAFAAPPDIISTRCDEIEVPLDSEHTSARLGGCADAGAEDLLWYLDRISHVDARLDGHYDRRNRGAGSVVYIMDTGVDAEHTEFAGSTGSRVIAGFDAAGSVHLGN